MPYTDAEVEDVDEWHVYPDHEVRGWSEEGLAKTYCLKPMAKAGDLKTVKAHCREDFFDSLRPASLAEWLAHPSVCESCRETTAERLGIEDEVAEAVSDNVGDLFP